LLSIKKLNILEKLPGLFPVASFSNVVNKTVLVFTKNWKFWREKAWLL